MKQKPLTPEELRNAIKMYEEGATTKEIGATYQENNERQDDDKNVETDK